ncbi:cyclic nucleotide-binding protein [Nitzschia inconspicua]|uniref:Cyclic nucleotide-binding protein n=1 Tax=Nitzschia inconspicua TaxID=303405 RepID=A0A9K3PRZ6_9STRA|nr:cyclic nucleotide-binding protein [Nitzschia inconspicua]
MGKNNNNNNNDGGSGGSGSGGGNNNNNNERAQPSNSTLASVSSLTGLFDPSLPPINNDDNDNGTTTTTSPVVTQQSSSQNDNDDYNDDNDDHNDDDSNNRKESSTAIAHSNGSLSHLMTLFAPPAPPPPALPSLSSKPDIIQRQSTERRSNRTQYQQQQQQQQQKNYNNTDDDDYYNQYDHHYNHHYKNNDTSTSASAAASEGTPLLFLSSSLSSTTSNANTNTTNRNDNNTYQTTRMLSSSSSSSSYIVGSDTMATPKTGSTGSHYRKDYNYNTHTTTTNNTTNNTNTNTNSHNRLLSTGHVRMPSTTIMPSIAEGQPETNNNNDNNNDTTIMATTTTTTTTVSAVSNLFFPNKLTVNHPSSHNNNNNNHHHQQQQDQQQKRCRRRWCYDSISNIRHALQQPSTYIGSFMYLLYHVVFCLALGSAIMRPNSNNSTKSILGLMTKTAALGTMAASPVYWLTLSSQIPALYPTADLFLAPFLAGLALIVDQTLADDPSVTVLSKQDNDAIFLATFGVLTAIGISLSSCLLMAASVFQLANLGSFLPFPVICGFFAAVGILTWTLAVNVDTDGQSISKIVTSGDTHLIMYALVHHVPTVIVAGVMKYLGPKHPFFVVMVVCVTIALFYCYMFVTGTSLEEMTTNGWFWSHDELIYNDNEYDENDNDEQKQQLQQTSTFSSSWSSPAPFGVLMQLHRVHWGAVQKGLSTAIALSFLYLIRCSVHGAALKKNIPNLARKVRSDDPILEKNKKQTSQQSNDNDNHNDNTANTAIVVGAHVLQRPPSIKYRTFSEAVDIEAVMQTTTTTTTTMIPSNTKQMTTTTNGRTTESNHHDNNNDSDNDNKDTTTKPQYEMYHAKPTTATLKTISLTYGKSQVVTALVGGFAITPSVAASTTMFSLGAERLAPQIGSVLLLLGFYLSDFRIVGYIPKPAFSSMLVLACIDMINTWFYKSYFKTKDKSEWMVVPAIVVCAFVLDLLSAVFLGIGFSTLIFVAAFFRSGVVKYVATGKVINSTIERTFRMSEWLNEEGDLIQILCLQNYLFFGNASSVFNYIGVSFEIGTEKDGGSSKRRKPEYLILDLTLVTGMDTSTVDVFLDIRNLCRANNCKLLMAGMSPNIRTILALGNFKPDTGIRSQRQLRFFPNLDSALGKAEDMLLENKYVDSEPQPSLLDKRRLVLEKLKDNGFRTALSHIDAEHGENFALELVGLQEYTTAIELETGEFLYEDGQSKGLERGLFFIESGVLKVEHSTDQTYTRGTQGSMRTTTTTTTPSSSSSSLGRFIGSNSNTITKIQQLSLEENPLSSVAGGPTFRLARIGVGWVAGTMEFFHMKRPGNQVAVDHCKLHHLPFSKIQDVETNNPHLALTLYKLLSYLMARRQEATIGQLATLHSIMTSPPRWRSLRRDSSSKLS